MTNLNIAKHNSMKNLFAALLVSAILTGSAFAQSPAKTNRRMVCGTPALMARRSSEAHLIVKNNCHHDVFVFVDGVEVGEVKDGCEEHFQILAGSHTLEAKEERTRARGSSRISVVERERFTWTVYDK